MAKRTVHPPIAVGNRFGRWTVLRLGPTGANRLRRWFCRCNCGTEKLLYGHALNQGKTQSCGCLNIELLRQRATHGHSRSKASTHSRTRTYIAWENMIARCTNPRHPSFGNYGARGISVCERWRFFVEFLADMGECPAGLSLERIDNARGYEPNNCCWTPWKRQMRNRRANLLVCYHGETMCLMDWAARLRISYGTLRSRLGRLGWSVEKAFDTPVGQTSTSH
jgi:hypothetical protein